MVSQLPAQPAPVTLFNVSCDPTCALDKDFNAAFARDWKARTSQEVWIRPDLQPEVMQLQRLGKPAEGFCDQMLQPAPRSA